MADIEENGYFQAKLAEFNAKYDEFQRVLNAVLSAQVTDPELQAEKDELVGRANWIQSLIQKAKDAINWVDMQMGQLGDTVGGSQNLGILPVIAVAGAVAAIAGAVAYMTAWISDAYIWSQKAEVANAVERAGGTPDDIARALKEKDGWFGNLATLGILAAVGGLVWWMQSR